MRRPDRVQAAEEQPMLSPSLREHFEAVYELCSTVTDPMLCVLSLMFLMCMSVRGVANGGGGGNMCPWAQNWDGFRRCQIDDENMKISNCIHR